MTKKKKQAIVDAIVRAKKSEFGVTAAKTEFEAQVGRDGEFRDTSHCHTWLMRELNRLGLTEFRRDEWLRLSHGAETQWHPIAPLTYAEFYNDGSVDSEFTFTLMLDDPETVFLIPKIGRIWNKFMREAGDGKPDVRGAGMHMAWLNSSDGSYPTSSEFATHFSNFQRSMTLLMPALYFLGTTTNTTRGLDFRRPGVGYDTHRTAIDYRNGALEFRVFDTCYDNLESILDNLVVMSRCMRYWSAQYVPSGLDKVTKRYKFGVDGDNTLDRFYITHVHIDLLNQGLVRLKPSYYTIGEIKLQRKFSKTKRGLVQLEKEQKRAALNEYSEYEERFKWRLLAVKGRVIENYSDRAMYEGGSPTVEQMEAETEVRMAQEELNRLSVADYIKRRLEEHQSNAGNHTLAIE
jgi:hypothetical protein